MRGQYIIFIALILMSCNREKGPSYVYGKEDYKEKEKHLVLDTEQAAAIYAKHYFSQHPNDTVVDVKLDIIYSDYYVFKEKREPYAPMLAHYGLSGIWINGQTGELKEVKTKDYTFAVLDFSWTGYEKRIEKEN